jgi:NADH:ubiquinone oxidoreductase subunit B-like Fe-S oxidoreductase
MNMKTIYAKTNLKDNIAATAVLTAAMVAILGSLIHSSDVRASYVVMQQMDAIVVTAPRIEVARFDTIVVTAPRQSNLVVAAN